MPFQTIVNTQPAPAVPGDFASANPRNFYPAGPGGLVSGPAGLTIANFAWVSSAFVDPDSGPIIVNNYGSGPVSGFVHRQQQGLITAFLADSAMTIPAGFMADIMVAGDVWIKNTGSGLATPGMFAYANFGTGAATFAATGAATNATSTASTVSAQTFSTTASVTGNVLNVTVVGSGTLYPGSVLSSTAASAVILTQLSGTVGGVGTYSLSVPEQTVASTTITGTYGLLTIGGTVAGTYTLGESISGTSVTTGSTITANASNGASLTGAGGAGTYVTLTATAGSTAITGATNVQTKWFAISSGLTGEIIRCSSQVLG